MRTIIIITIIINIFSFTKAQSTISYSYDSQGRLLSENYQSKFQLSFTYDLEGNFINKTTTNIGVTGIDDNIIELNTNILVFPNPVNKKVNIQTNNPENKITEIIISDLLGRCLFLEKTDCYSIQVDTDYLKRGIYLLSIKTEQKLKIYKLQKE